MPFRLSASPLRAVDLAPLDVLIEQRADGAICACATQPLAAYEKSVTARLRHWAQVAPQRIFIAQRAAKGAWQSLTFAEAYRAACGLGQALLDRKLDANHPLVILSGNSIAHACLALGALHVGIPYAPISPASALVSHDFARLRRIIGLMTPGLIFAENGHNFAPAIAAAVPDDIEVVTGDAPLRGRRSSDFASLIGTRPDLAVEAAHAKVNGDTLAKILFTSGSFTAPKPVITTHRMLCANQTMIGQALRFLHEEPPVLVDWLPWHHSFGGNHNFGMALQHGGTLYIDRGRPTDAGLAETIAALREVSPTLFFNVPQGFEKLLPQLAQDLSLARNFFRALKLNFFAGAAMAPRIHAALDEIALATCGERIAMISGFGATETSPSVLFQTDPALWDLGKAFVGVPLPGNELKLVPQDGRYEARVKGPNVTQGYWRDAELTRQAYDDEGYYRLGDALRLADGERPRQGFIFEGRIGEDFKLASGIPVNAVALRTRLMAAGAPYIADVAIAGEGRTAVAALVFPDLAACRALAGEYTASASAEEILGDPAVAKKFDEILERVAAQAGGASERISRMALLAEPASLDAGEITDKATLNRRAVLARRADVVERLYNGNTEALIIAGLPDATPPFEKA